MQNELLLIIFRNHKITFPEHTVSVYAHLFYYFYTSINYNHPAKSF